MKVTLKIQKFTKATAFACNTPRTNVCQIQLKLNPPLLDNGKAVFAQVLADALRGRQRQQLRERPRRQLLPQLLHEVFEITKAPADQPLQAAVSDTNDVRSVLSYQVVALLGVRNTA